MTRSIQRRRKLKDTCEHDLRNPIRKGRTDYRCRKCGADVTLEIVLLAEAGLYDDYVRGT